MAIHLSIEFHMQDTLDTKSRKVVVVFIKSLGKCIYIYKCMKSYLVARGGKFEVPQDDVNNCCRGSEDMSSATCSYHSVAGTKHLSRCPAFSQC